MGEPRMPVGTGAETGAAEEASGKTERRNELASFLRSRRERITPGDVGPPGGPRGRTAGRRGREGGQRARGGVTGYTRPEAGRPRRARRPPRDAAARARA